MPSNPPKIASRRPPATLQPEELAEQLNASLDQVDAVVETLVSYLVKGEPIADAFTRLHGAAVRDRRIAELAFAYEQATLERRTRALAPEVQGALFGHVAEFYFDLMDDWTSALGWAEKAMLAHPCREPHFLRLERWAADIGASALPRLARARIALAKDIEDPDTRRSWLAQALLELSSETNAAVALEALDALLAIDHDFTDAVLAFEARLIEAGRYRDAARRMEARLQSESGQGADVQATREKLLQLYTNELADPFKAIVQVEALVAKDPGHPLAIAAAEKLISVPSVAPRALSALADAQYATGNLDRAAALLSQELKVARGPRRQEVQGKLAILRQDILGDAAGALELLGPVVAVDASRDEFRDRFVHLSLSLNRTNDAVRLLSRALQSAKDPALRSRLGCDLGAIVYHSGEGRKARGYLEDVIRADNDPSSKLRAARLLSQIYQEAGETQLQVGMLQILIELETDSNLREFAAYQFIQLSRQLGLEEQSLTAAWWALVHSAHADEALSHLKQQYEGGGQSEELASVYELIAARTQELTERTRIYWHAAELRASITKDPASLINLWRNLMVQCGASKEALDRLIPLLEAELRTQELADALQLRIDLSPDDERASIWARLGHIRLKLLGQPQAALRAHANALALDPASALSRADLEALLEIPECQVEAAALLEPLVRAEPAGNALFNVLMLRAQSFESVDERFTYYDEAFHLAVDRLGQSAWGLRVACRALRDAFDFERGELDGWVNACTRLQAAVLASDRVAAFTELLGERTLEQPALLQIAVMAIDALHEAGDPVRAEHLLRYALEFEPTSPELLMRLEEIIASQASPEERLVLYRDALSKNHLPERQRDIYARIAHLLQTEFRREDEAIEAWQKVLELDPQHLGAHRALLALYEQKGDNEATAAELNRALAVATGERRQRMLEQLSQVEERRGDLVQALARAQESLLLGPLDPGHLLRVQQLAERAGDLEVMQKILEVRLAKAPNDGERVDILSALGESLIRKNNPDSAVPMLRDAALLARRLGDQSRERALLERAVELKPTDLLSLTRLVEQCASVGDIDAISKRIEVWLAAGADEREVARVILDLEAVCRASEKTEQYVALCGNSAKLVRDPVRSRNIQLAAARVLQAAGDFKKSAEIYHALVVGQNTIDRDVVVPFMALLASCPNEPEWQQEWRWLFEQRVKLAADPVSVLLEWATHEERNQKDDPAALAVLDRILSIDPTRLDVWSEVARLRHTMGDAEGTLAALEHIAPQEDSDKRVFFVIQQARLLVGPLNRPAEALDKIESVLAEQPSDPEVLAIIKAALELPVVRQRAAELLQRVVTLVNDPSAQIAVLESLLQVTRDTQGFESARAEWTLQLLDLRGDNDESSLALILQEASVLATQDALWDRAEQIARNMGQPEGVLHAYNEAFVAAIVPEVAEQVGRRLVEFQEEWSDDVSKTLPLMQTIFEKCEGATWAFERLKLAYNAAARWSELFALYDRAIERQGDASDKAETLREAAMAAKDFANDAERAISYFERLDHLCPNDPRVEGALERLYERQSLTRPLIELLVRQMNRSRTVQSQFPYAVRVGNYWLDLGEPLPAFELVDGLLRELTSEVEVVALLERMVALPGAREAFPPAAPAGKKDKRDKKPLSVRDRAALRLRKYYESVGNTVDVVRMLEIEVDLANDKSDRISRLRRIIDVRLSELNDEAGALENAVVLFELAPERDELRALFDDLSNRCSARLRQVDLLVEVAGRFSGAPLRVVLLREAADLAHSALNDTERAIALYSEVLDSAGSDVDNACRAAHQLDLLLKDTGRSLERCDVLERLAEIEPSAEVRKQVLGEAASVALDHLGDPERAVKCWRRRLSDDVDDGVARDGLVVALERTSRFEELIEALLDRAGRSTREDLARADRVRVAEIWRRQLGSAERAIAAWQFVRQAHGRDEESYASLVELFSETSRFRELADLVEDEAGATTEPARAKLLQQFLGQIYAEKLGETALALKAYVNAEDWEHAVAVVTSVRHDAALALATSRDLLARSTEIWLSSNASAECPAARTAIWTIAEITNNLKQAGTYADIVQVLLQASRLPFPPNERRSYQRDAAYVCSNYLDDKSRAVELYQSIIHEDPADGIAAHCIAPLAALLEQSGQTTELIELWEGQAAVNDKRQDSVAAAALYARAALLAEAKLGDIERALLNYGRAAELGLESALEALARLHDSRGEYQQSAVILERYCAVANRESLGERSLWLAQAYIQCGRSDAARTCLEHASSNASDVGAVRERLATLYEEAGLWLPLAEVLTTEALRSADARERLKLLVKAARVHREQRNDAVGAVPLLRQAVQLDPDNVELRLELADALSKAEQHEDSCLVLKDQVARYGARRPKERAMVHYALAKERLALGDSATALEELQAASRIDPARSEILALSARLSLKLGDLDAAEKTLRSLLLVLGRGNSNPELSRVEALLDLSQIAAQRNDVIRSGEYVESAFEVAHDSELEAQAFERVARGHQRTDWLLRLLEERLARATRPTIAAPALLDLTRMHAETLGDLNAVAQQLSEQAHQLHEKLGTSRATDDNAWSALNQIYEYLGDDEAQSKILEMRVQGWLEGKTPIDDPKPVLRMGALRLKTVGKEKEGIELLELAHQAGAQSQELEAIVAPYASEGAVSARAMDLLEKAARVDGNTPLLARSLSRRIRQPGSTESQYLELLDLLRTQKDEGGLVDLLRAAVTDRLTVKLSEQQLAAARLELADFAIRNNDLASALELREGAAELIGGSERKAILLECARDAVNVDQPDFNERAIRIYEKLLKDEPAEVDYWEPWLNVLRKTGDMQRLESAIDRTTQSVTRPEHRSQLRLERSRLLIDLGKEQAAADELHALLEEDPTQADATIMLVGILEHTGKHEELIQMLRLQLEGSLRTGDSESSVKLLTRLAELNERLGHLDEALSALERALNFQGANRVVLERIVELSERMGESQRAIAALQMLQDAEEDTHAKLLLLDKLYGLNERTGDPSGLLQVARDAFNCAPSDGIWQARLFDVLETQGDLEGLAGALGRAAAASPGEVGLSLRLVKTYQALGNHSHALEVLDGLLATGAASAELSVERGRLLLELERFDEAIAELALADDGSVTAAQMLLDAIEVAWSEAGADKACELGIRKVSLLQRLDRVEEADSILSQLYEQHPTDLAVLSLWADRLSKQGDTDEALEVFERIVLAVRDEDVEQTIDQFLPLCSASQSATRPLAALERAVPLLPERLDLRQRLIEIYRLLGANKKLGKLLLVQAEYESDPASKHTLLLQGVELLLTERLDDSSIVHRALDQARELAPESLEATILAARLHAAEGHADTAIDLLQTTAQANRGRRSKSLANLYRELSEISLQHGLKGEALDALLRAFEMDSKNGQLAMQTGRLAMEVENHDIAVRVFARVAMMKPVDDDPSGESISRVDRADANYCLAYLSYNQGDARKAKILALKSLSDNPEHEQARQLVDQLG